MDFDSLLNKGINYVKSRFQADSILLHLMANLVLTVRRTPMLWRC